MNYPHFLDIEASSPDDDAYPTQISWSLDDGSIKTAIVCPDDDWEPWYNCDSEIDVQYLLDTGATPSEIIKELNDDLSGQTVFVDGFDADEELLDRLFSATLSEPDFELAQAGELFLNADLESVAEQIRDSAMKHNLDPRQSEDGVRALLFTYAEQNGVAL